MPPAIAPPDPGLFSTRNGWPSTSDNFSATIRATTSVPPPAPNPTRMRTGLPGQISASAALICAHNKTTADMTVRQDIVSAPGCYDHISIQQFRAGLQPSVDA